MSEPHKTTSVKVNKGLPKKSIRASITSAFFKNQVTMLLLSTASLFQISTLKSRSALLEREALKCAPPELEVKNRSRP